MSGTGVLALVLAALALVASLYAVRTRYVLRSVLSFGLVFFVLGFIYMALGQPFVGLVQILLYVGGVAVLTVFAFISSLNVKETEAAMAPTSEVGAIAASLTTLLLAATFYELGRFLPATIEPPTDGSAVGIGTLLMTRHLLEFEIISILLLASLVASLAIIRHGRREKPQPEAAASVSAETREAEARPTAEPERPRKKRPIGPVRKTGGTSASASASASAASATPSVARTTTEAGEAKAPASSEAEKAQEARKSSSTSKPLARRETSAENAKPRDAKKKSTGSARGTRSASTRGSEGTRRPRTSRGPEGAKGEEQ
jgi:NADH-quinone oxidoreductase subunit J